METSTEIKQISMALLNAQKEMVNAVKDSNNPFFKSKYADLNSVREACMPSLNKYGISIIQPIVCKDSKSFVNTILLHESGEFLSGLTEIVYAKQNDAQAQGSGITYARRYGMQSFVNVGCEDDDGNKASTPPTTKTVTAPAKETTPENWLVPADKEKWEKAVEFIGEGDQVERLAKTKRNYKLRPEQEAQLLLAVVEYKKERAKRLVKA